MLLSVKKYLSLITAFLCFGFLFVQNTFAQGLLANPIGGPGGYNSLTGVLLGVLDGIIIILIPILSLGVVFIGFKMVMAGSTGKPEDLAKLKNAFLYSLVGLFLVLGAKGILSVVENTVGNILA